ncbi:NADH dehydrogenase [ubiquinone] 1 alpha subcomplex subunit 6 [Vitis vinifera]|uniref:NADH dehydrogenase [ubiquinone] 1 alpha subcomplex subunit 6 n=1 Tax=Vitis vinifera TaxID=29760 RepID=A0A438DLP9_VITVI|nr:NADH dehydrogenase [ubiquinone] 1 alpha subcomplex subunit 6 [Vitis vinifera]
MASVMLKNVRVPANSANLEEARSRTFDFFKMVCRSIPKIMDIYNLDDVVTVSQLRSIIASEFRKNSDVTNTKFNSSMHLFASLYCLSGQLIEHSLRIFLEEVNAKIFTQGGIAHLRSLGNPLGVEGVFCRSKAQDSLGSKPFMLVLVSLEEPLGWNEQPSIGVLYLGISWVLPPVKVIDMLLFKGMEEFRNVVEHSKQRHHIIGQYVLAREHLVQDAGAKDQGMSEFLKNFYSSNYF